MKKGAFNISIQAIVVLILAITILGFGLTFIRGLFNDESDLLTYGFIACSEQVNASYSINYYYAYADEEMLLTPPIFACSTQNNCTLLTSNPDDYIQLDKEICSVWFKR